MKKKLISLVFILCLVIALIPINAVKAEAAMTTARTTAPAKTNSYYYGNNNWFAANGWINPQSGGNCTWYAYGRAYEYTGKVQKLSINSACTWYDSWNGSKGKTPRAGSIICWSGGSSGDGHVAFVEKVNKNGDIFISNSGWSRIPSWYQSSSYQSTTSGCISSGWIKKGTTNWDPWYPNSGYRLDGFIYLSTCSHNTNTTTGKCKNCGAEYINYDNESTSVKTSYENKRYYKIKTETYLKVYPLSSANNKSSAKLPAGKHVSVLGTVSSGNWYKIKYGSTSKYIGYVPKSAIEKYTPDKSSSTIAINSTKSEYSSQHGVNTSFSATTSSNYPIRSITMTVGGKTWSKTFNELYLSKGIGMQSWTKMNLSKLSVGTYDYTFTTKDISGASKTVTGKIVIYDADVKAPTITVKNVENGKDIIITNNADGKLYFSKNGGTVYYTNDKTKKIELRQTGKTSIKAFGYTSDGKKRSTNKTIEVTVSQLDIPSINIEQEGKAGNVTFKSPDNKANIKYKIGDGSYKTYDGSVISVEDGVTISAYAQRNGYIKSEVTTAETEFAEPKAPVAKLVNEDSKIAAGKTATVSWAKDKRAVSYTASLYAAGGALVEEKTTKETTVSFTLENAGEYYVEVTAANDIGTSDISDRITFTAVDPLTVVFKSGAGEDAEILSELKVDYGEKMEQIPAPSKKGYTFEGWENTATNVVSLNAYTKTAVKEDAEYVASYSKNTYKVKLYDTDGTLLETQSVKYEESTDTEGIQVTLKEGYAFAGWHVSWTADGNSAADYTKVDSDMDIRAVASWADKELPVIVKVTSAEQTEDGKYINVDISLTTSGEEDLSMYLVAALKAKDTTTGVEKTVYADRKIIYLDAGETTGKTTTMKMKADAKGLSSIEVTAMQCNEDLSTGSAYSKTVSAPITISKHWGEWSDWAVTQPEEAETRDIDSKKQYRVSNKVYTYSGYDTLEGYTKESTETISTTYGGWKTSKPSAATSTTTANKTVTSVENTAAYRWFAYYCDCKKVCWKTKSGSCKYCGGKTDNTLIIYSKNIPTKYDSDGAYHFPKTMTASAGGNYRLIFWNGTSVSSFTTKAITEETYLWKSSTFSRTIYRTKTVKTRNKFSKWDEWSEWVDTEYAATATRKVEGRTVYRYRDLDVETSGTVDLDPSGKLTKSFTGKIDVSEDLNGKVATIMVYQANNTDPNKYQMQYLGQTQIGEQNSYDFSFIPKEEPTVDTGNYIVSLGVQGSTGLITVGLVEAPVKEHTVTLYYKDAKGARHDIGKAQVVENHGDVDLSNVVVPEQEGYYFVGWSQRTTDITGDCEIEAIHVPVQNTVVFVDWINEELSIEKALTGEKVELPGRLEDSKGYKFKGWKLEDGTIIDPEEITSIEVTGDMVVTAEFEPIKYTVKFMSVDGTVVDTQTVKHGEAAEPPAYEPEAGIFVGWDTDADWWSVEKDTEVYPIIIYDEAALKPEYRLIVDEETDQISLELTTEEENADIYYTTDGTLPTGEKIAEYINSNTNDYGGSVEKYTAPLKFGEDTVVTAVSYISGKTESEVCTATYSLEPNNIDSIAFGKDGWHELGTYNMKAKAGKDITVEVDMKETTGLVGYDFLVICDDEVFYVDRDEYDEPVCENGEAFKDGVLTTSDTEEGIRMHWVTDETNEENGQLFKLTIHVEELAEEGRYPITVCYAPENTLNADYDEVNAEQLKVSVKSQASVDISTYDISLARTTYVYEGSAIEPAVNIAGLKESEDYTVAYENNINVGAAKAIITGMGEYEGTVEKEFSITAANIANADVDGLKDYSYTGSAIEPDLTVTYNGTVLEEGKDYEITFKNNVEAGKADVTISGKGNFSGKNELEFEIIKTAENENDVNRVFGNGRIDTSIGAANQLKEELGVDKFENVVVATAYNFADALPGSYVAAEKNAPILLIDEDYAEAISKYINDNMDPDGNVYILGGEGVVPSEWLATVNVDDDQIVRLGGTNRYGTNLEILKAAPVADGATVMVCTGMNFADSLSASATGNPILLADDGLTKEQIAYLESIKGKCDFCMIGGTGAVPESIAKAIAAYDKNGKVDRAAGASRFETSALVAEMFISDKDPKSAVLAYGYNFPDGLSGGPIAYAMGAPLLLTASDLATEYTPAKDYMATEGIKSGYILGGPALITDDVAKTIFGLAKSTMIN